MRQYKRKSTRRQNKLIQYSTYLYENTKFWKNSIFFNSKGQYLTYSAVFLGTY